MAINIGIVGLPNVGKSTLFNALCDAGAESANFPFCTIEPNVGIVPVPDARLSRLAEVYSSAKTIPTSLEFVDIAGLVRGASKGEGLGNKFLSHIRQVNAVVHVVRAFDDQDVVHVDGSIDPVRDVEVIDTELVFADLDTVERRRDKTVKVARSGDKQAKADLEALSGLHEHLLAGRPARLFDTGGRESAEALLRELWLLTNKPVIYVANVAEADAADPDKVGYVQSLRRLADDTGAKMLCISAAIEEELSQLEAEERLEYMESMGISEPGLDKVIQAGYEALELLTFLTAGPQESRAWTTRRGARAPQAAGVIHTDFERGFIKAEVMAFDDLIEMGSEAAVKQAGKMRIEGKDYAVKDGDIMHFRFNV